MSYYDLPITWVIGEKKVDPRKNNTIDSVRLWKQDKLD